MCMTPLTGAGAATAARPPRATVRPVGLGRGGAVPRRLPPKRDVCNVIQAISAQEP